MPKSQDCKVTVFSKIFVASDGGQVLFFKDSNDVGPNIVTMSTATTGVVVTMTTGFKDTDDGWNKRDAEFDNLDSESAEDARALIKRQFGDIL